MNPAHILIVDDEEDIRTLLHYNLQKEGFKVDVVADCLACLEFIQKEKPTLILLDVMMPQLDGIEVCERINLGYRDPASINIEDYANREDEGVLLVRKAGEQLYRLRDEKNNHE